MIFFKEDPDVITFKNGQYCLSTRTYEKLDPSKMLAIKSFNRIPVDFDPNAKCPNIEKFLEEIAPEYKTLLIEWAGYCLYKSYPIQKALIMIGEGANGKSTYFNVLKAFVGHENTASRGFQDLEYDKFAKAELFGRLLNVQADISQTALKKTQEFKGLTGSDYLTAERKYGQPFQFMNYAKLAYSANNPPKFEEDIDANWRRLIPITLIRRFEGQNAIPQDVLLAKLTTTTDLSGLLNLALEALHQILEKNEFSYNPTINEVRQYYKARSDPLPVFIEDCVEQDTDSYEPKAETYATFNAYCKSKKIPCAVSRSVFTTKLREETYALPADRMIEGIRTPVYLGIKLKCNSCKGKCKQSGPTGRMGPLFYTFEKNVQENLEYIKDPSHPSHPSQDNNKTSLQGIQPSKETDKKPLLFEKLDMIKSTFEACHNIASTDYIASKIGVTSEEAENLLNALKREGTVTYDVAKEFWRWWAP